MEKDLVVSLAEQIQDIFDLKEVVKEIISKEEKKKLLEEFDIQFKDVPDDDELKKKTIYLLYDLGIYNKKILII